MEPCTEGKVGAHCLVSFGSCWCSFFERALPQNVGGAKRTRAPHTRVFGSSTPLCVAEEKTACHYNLSSLRSIISYFLLSIIGYDVASAEACQLLDRLEDSVSTEPAAWARWAELVASRGTRKSGFRRRILKVFEGFSLLFRGLRRNSERWGRVET